MRYPVYLVMLFSLVTACSTKAPEDPGKKSPPKQPKIVGSRVEPGGVSFDAKQLANELESNYVAEVRFNKGSAELTSDSRRSLSSVMKRAGSEDFLQSAKLITWADKEMPAEKSESLSKEDIELVERRNEALARFIQNSEGDIPIDRISMAERPRGLSKMIPDETERIQESLEKAGLPNTGEKKDVPGKASRAIIIFTRE